MLNELDKEIEKYNSDDKVITVYFVSDSCSLSQKEVSEGLQEMFNRLSDK
jgi:hypothetical protein